MSNGQVHLEGERTGLRQGHGRAPDAHGPNATPQAALAAEEVIVANGVVLAPSKLYRITVNNFIQSGGDGFTVLAGGTNVLGGEAEY